MKLIVAILVLSVAQPARAEDLIGGSPDSRHAVVRVLSSVGSCTGTYLGSGRIVTAAHCVPGGASSDRDVLIGFVRDQTTTLASHRVVRDPILDLAMVEIDEGRLGPAIAPIRTLGRDQILSAAEIGEDVTLVGFGAGGERRSGLSTLIEIEADRLTVGSDATQARACFGDSGGPLLVTRGGVEYLAGVLSTGAADCSGVDHYVRVDTGGGAALVEDPAATGCSAAGSGSILGLLPLLALRRRSRSRHARSRCSVSLQRC